MDNFFYIFGEDFFDSLLFYNEIELSFNLFEYDFSDTFLNINELFYNINPIIYKALKENKSLYNNVYQETSESNEIYYSNITEKVSEKLSEKIFNNNNTVYNLLISELFHSYEDKYLIFAEHFSGLTGSVNYNEFFGGDEYKSIAYNEGIALKNTVKNEKINYSYYNTDSASDCFYAFDKYFEKKFISDFKSDFRLTNLFDELNETENIYEFNLYNSLYDTDYFRLSDNYTEDYIFNCIRAFNIQSILGEYFNENKSADAHYIKNEAPINKLFNYGGADYYENINNNINRYNTFGDFFYEDGFGNIIYEQPYRLNFNNTFDFKENEVNNIDNVIEGKNIIADNLIEGENIIADNLIEGENIIADNLFKVENIIKDSIFESRTKFAGDIIYKAAITDNILKSGVEAENNFIECKGDFKSFDFEDRSVKLKQNSIIKEIEELEKINKRLEEKISKIEETTETKKIRQSIKTNNTHDELIYILRAMTSTEA